MPSSSTGGGLGVIVFGCIGVSVIITLVTGSCFHWPFVLGGILVGLMAARCTR